MSTIIVGLDDSDTSRLAFHEAIRQARWRSARVVAVHIVHYPAAVGFEGTIGMPDLMKSGEEFVARELGRLTEEYDGDFGVEVEGVVRSGHPGSELVNMSRDVGDGPAELVVLGSRGFGGLRGVLLGSVTTYVTHHLSRPLLIIPADSTPATDRD